MATDDQHRPGATAAPALGARRAAVRCARRGRRGCGGGPRLDRAARRADRPGSIDGAGARGTRPRVSASVADARRARVTPWRGSGDRLALERRVLVRRPRRARRRPRRRRAAAGAATSSSAEQDHGDVVAPAGLVGGGDQVAARARRASAGRRPGAARARPRGPSRSARPSRAGTRRRPRAGVHVDVDLDVGSGPSARVMTERCGCASACSSVSLPRRTSSPTSEWSSVSRISSPSRSR